MRYKSRHVVSVCLDDELWEKLAQIPNKSAFIRGLVAREIGGGKERLVGGAGMTRDEVLAIVQEYLTAHPPTPQPTTGGQVSEETSQQTQATINQLLAEF